MNYFLTVELLQKWVSMEPPHIDKLNITRPRTVFDFPAVIHNLIQSQHPTAGSVCYTQIVLILASFSLVKNLRASTIIATLHTSIYTILT